MLKEDRTPKLKYKKVTENNASGNDESKENWVSTDAKWGLLNICAIWFPLTIILKGTLYKEKNYIWDHSFGDFSLRLIDPIALGRASSEWQQHVTKQNCQIQGQDAKREKRGDEDPTTPFKSCLSGQKTI